MNTMEENVRPLVRIVDDDAAIRDSLSQLVLASMDVRVACFASGEGFMGEFDVDDPGCIVTDACMTGISGLELVRRLKELAPELPVLIVTAYADVPMAIEAMDLGVFGFVEKPFRADEILDRLREAIAYDHDERVRSENRERTRAALEKLTAREREVLDHLVEGDAMKEIATSLGVSPQAIARHRSRIHAKFEVDSDVELVRKVLDANLG